MALLDVDLDSKETDRLSLEKEAAAGLLNSQPTRRSIPHRIRQNQQLKAVAINPKYVERICTER